MFRALYTPPHVMKAGITESLVQRKESAAEVGLVIGTKSKQGSRSGSCGWITSFSRDCPARPSHPMVEREAGELSRPGTGPGVAAAWRADRRDAGGGGAAARVWGLLSSHSGRGPADTHPAGA